MTTSPLGIDISKRKFDACLVRDAGKLRHKVFPNTAAGHAQLSAWLTKYQVEHAHACLEATGTYGEAAPAEFVLVPGPGGRPKFLHSLMGAARRIQALR